MKNIKGIILDVDGVIIGEKIGYNSPNPHFEIIERLKSLQKQGINISLCTAKPQFAIKKIIEDAKLSNLHITDGGGVIINPIKDVIVKKHSIDGESAKKVLQMYLKNNVYTEFYTVNDYIIQESQFSNVTDEHAHILQQEPKMVKSLIDEAELSEITKIMPIAKNEKDKERLTKLFKKLNTDLTLSWGVHPVALPLQFGIITAAGISKKQGAIDVVESSDITFSDMLAVGDSLSDWQFIELCKYGATMQNGKEELKKLVSSKGEGCFYIGGHVDKNGLLEILNYFSKV